MAKVFLLPNFMCPLIVMAEGTSLRFYLVISQVKSAISFRFWVVFLLLNFNLCDDQFRLF